MKLSILLSGLLFLSLTACMIDGADGRRVPFWEMSNELWKLDATDRHLKRCGQLTRHYIDRIDVADGLKEKLIIGDEYDLEWIKMGCPAATKARD